MQAIGLAAGGHRVNLTGQGRARALELLSTDQYVGPAPVSFADYVERVTSQSVRDIAITEADAVEAFRDLVLAPGMVSQLGASVVSGRAIFLYSELHTAVRDATREAKVADSNGFGYSSTTVNHRVRVVKNQISGAEANRPGLSSATSSVSLKPNCKVMTETPAALVDDMRCRPDIWPSWRSSGAVTVWLITSGLAPG